MDKIMWQICLKIAPCELELKSDVQMSKKLKNYKDSETRIGCQEGLWNNFGKDIPDEDRSVHILHNEYEVQLSNLLLFQILSPFNTSVPLQSECARMKDKKTMDADRKNWVH